MTLAIIIPAFNEELFLQNTLQSVVSQSQWPDHVIVIDDNSTDNTAEIAHSFAKAYPFIKVFTNKSKPIHQPGGKVIDAFKKGLEQLEHEVDLLLKLDADIILPENYIAELCSYFEMHPRCGMAGGVAWIEKNGAWQMEQLTNTDHIRGAFKAYRTAFYKQMGGLPSAMGWDTWDELMAHYYGWSIYVNQEWQLKHLKVTGKSYHVDAHKRQGQAFYQLGYGFVLTGIASIKLALKKGKPSLAYYYVLGYIFSYYQNLPKIVTKEQEIFIRNLRWRGILKKLKLTEA